jgi:hypothetical protein
MEIARETARGGNTFKFDFRDEDSPGRTANIESDATPTSEKVGEAPKSYRMPCGLERTSGATPRASQPSRARWPICSPPGWTN